MINFAKKNSGPAELRDGDGFALANCDYVWRNENDDTIHLVGIPDFC